MKVTVFDFILSGIIMLCLWVISGFISFYYLNPILTGVFGPYAYIISSLLFFIFFGLLSALTLQILLKIKPLELGEFSMESPNFVYWKLLTMIQMFGFKSLFLINLPPFVPLLYVLFGAKIGRNVAIGGTIDSPFLVEIGENSVLGHGSLISGNVIHDGKINLAPVKIGTGSTVGVYSLVLPNVTIGNNATLSPGSVVISGTDILDQEIWKGNPARKWQ